MLLTGKVALVTGAGRGIGRAIAIRFAARGAAVVLAARSSTELEEAASEIRGGGGEALAFPCDVADPGDVSRLFRFVEAQYGGVDILVNNAGYACFKPFEALTLDDWNLTLQVNLTSVFLCTQAALPGMKQRGGGRIINVSSVSGLKGIEEQSAYCAAKHGLNGLSKTLAMELRPYNIAVHALCPGAVATRLAMDAMPGRDVSDWMRPDDVAHTALYLATLPDGATVDLIHLRRFNSTPL